MEEVFPEFLRSLPEAEIPMDGVEAYLLQGEDKQVVFARFHSDFDMPPHAHCAQFEAVMAGKVDLTIDGETRTYQKGDRFYIPEGVEHSARIHAGFTTIMFFDHKDRYRIKEES
jgi:quercetin dioxygenase-like cupin family protein